tara:strand:+ start:52 stop:282 length:231 start_codon:yes stop_codon:yes gene_type:complete
MTTNEIIHLVKINSASHSSTTINELKELAIKAGQTLSVFKSRVASHQIVKLGSQTVAFAFNTEEEAAAYVITGLVA